MKLNGNKKHNDMRFFSRTLARVFVVATTMWGLASCTEQEEVLGGTEETAKTCVLNFNVSCVEYDAPDTRTATSTTWTDGDRVYLTFENSAYGVATYQSGSWSVEYYGTLTENEERVCKAVYFENPISYEEFQAVNMTHETAAYEDEWATCLYDGSLLTVTANLQPKTGRLRFKGSEGDTLRVYGLITSSRYSVYKGEYTDDVHFIELVTNDEGYTPYIYGEFVDTVDRRLNVMNSESAYTRVFSDTVMNRGESGWLSVPTATAHAAWREKMIFKVRDTEFAMMPVTEGGRLSFLLGETEVTEGLYNALTESEAERTNYPKAFTYFSECSEFFSALNDYLGVDFSLPTRAQWEWAYIGGERSLGYAYSGSNNLEEVGWCQYNSVGFAHDVAMLMPNELGIYDMFGNYSEWCFAYTDEYGFDCYPYAYSDFSKTDVEWSYTNYSSTSISNVGIRMKLSF